MIAKRESDWESVKCALELCYHSYRKKASAFIDPLPHIWPLIGPLSASED